MEKEPQRTAKEIPKQIPSKSKETRKQRLFRENPNRFEFSADEKGDWEDTLPFRTWDQLTSQEKFERSPSESIESWHLKILNFDPFQCRAMIKKEFGDWTKEFGTENRSIVSIFAEKKFFYITIKRSFIELLQDHSDSFMTAYFFNDKDCEQYWFIIELKYSYQIFQDTITESLLNHIPNTSFFDRTQLKLTFLEKGASLSFLPERNELEKIKIKKKRS